MTKGVVKGQNVMLSEGGDGSYNNPVTGTAFFFHCDVTMTSLMQHHHAGCYGIIYMMHHTDCHPRTKADEKTLLNDVKIILVGDYVSILQAMIFGVFKYSLMSVH